MNLIQKWAVKLLRLPTQPVEPRYVQMPASEITLVKWRANQKLVGAAIDLSKHQTYALQMQCLTNEHPAHTVLALGASPNDRVAHLGRIEGYEMALNNLHAFTQLQKLPEQLESTFESEQTLTQKSYARTHRP